MAGKSKTNEYEEEMTEFEKEFWERHARGRAAWGAFSVEMRQRNLNDEISELRTKLSSSYINKKEIEERVKELIESRSTGRLYVG